MMFYVLCRFSPNIAARRCGKCKYSVLSCIAVTFSEFCTTLSFLLKYKMCTVPDLNYGAKFLYGVYMSSSAFSALTLLVGQQEGHLACKN